MSLRTCEKRLHTRTEQISFYRLGRLLPKHVLELKYFYMNKHFRARFKSENFPQK